MAENSIANLRTVKQFVAENPAFTEGGVRNYIFWEEQNGLTASGAIKRIGRKILIDTVLFGTWVEQQQIIRK